MKKPVWNRVTIIAILFFLSIGVLGFIMPDNVFKFIGVINTGLFLGVYLVHNY